MHGNYVRSLFTVETGHGMRSSLGRESIWREVCVRETVFVLADVFMRQVECLLVIDLCFVTESLGSLLKVVSPSCTDQT